jgi:hypothetical protein
MTVFQPQINLILAPLPLRCFHAADSLDGSSIEMIATDPGAVV